MVTPDAASPNRVEAVETPCRVPHECAPPMLTLSSEMAAYARLPLAASARFRLSAST